ARDLTRILENDAMMSASISAQLQLVTMQWLTANQPAFHPDLIGPNVLERLIRQHVRIVEFSNLTAAGDINTTVPRTAKLYTKQEPSERFVLILEGRVTVTIGQNEMQFEAGPWHCFGEEVLRKLVEVAPALAQHAIPHVATGLSFSRQSLTGDAPDLRKRHAASFIPDFSAVVKDDCTYLEITVHTYLSAYRATLMQKGTRYLDENNLRLSISAADEQAANGPDSDTSAHLLPAP
uniref:Cyclic nucleotide-binding domain-containing protein n=1 Tax=Plectus sambesii TaxID=2011161 RepID=A0A914UUR1_9BILA